MNSQYSEIYRKADRLFYRLKDVVDQPDAPQMQALQREVKQIVEDIEADRKPRAIEERVKRVQSTYRDLSRADSELIDASDADELYGACENLREDLRRMPNY